jgi:hypothetical protein
VVEGLMAFDISLTAPLAYEQATKSRVRIELHSQVGVERQAAAVRIAAS